MDRHCSFLCFCFLARWSDLRLSLLYCQAPVDFKVEWAALNDDISSFDTANVGKRKLLDTEKLVFRTDSSGNVLVCQKLFEDFACVTFVISFCCLS